MAIEKRLIISLEAARVNAEVSRAEVEKETGIAADRLGRCERGEAEPRGEELKKLCEFYNVGIGDLRFDVGKKKKEKNKDPK